MFDLSPASLISRAIVLLIGMTIHEFAHAYVANLMGDSTAREQGRMTLDPRANIYWPGFIIGVLIGFGILGSAPVNPARMRDSRWGMFAAVLAGPVSNLIIGAIAAVPFALGLMSPTLSSGSGLLGAIAPTLPRLLTEMVLLNVLLFVFNLLPFPPLDGWTVVERALPRMASIWWQRQRMTLMYIGIGLMALSFIGPNLLATLPFLGAVPFIEYLLNPLSLILQPAYWISFFLMGI